jgi:deoxyribodipyrimidine photo-lyase
LRSEFSIALCWLRRDLRLHDHRPLAEACAGAAVVPVFIFDTTILDSLGRDDRRVTFIHRSLQELDGKLREHGSMLIVRHGDPVAEIPRLASELGAGAVYAGRDYEPAAKERDELVRRKLLEDGRALHLLKDHVVFDGDEVVTGEGNPFKVFTPYRNAWMLRLAAEGDAPIAEWKPDLTRLAPASTIGRHARGWSMRSLGFTARGNWLEPGEDAGRRRLKGFLERIEDYAALRDIPAADGTSGLSVHIRFGTVSARELLRAARDHGGEGAAAWTNELIWREFYQMILDRFPHVEHGAFRREYDAIAWPGSTAHFEAWCEGRTGYPIVDAAMRGFNATGWMHNRLRMVVASFLVKDLLIDWRWGERYFARHLLDYDMAANNGNWQWAASTGCDAQPYFRIFNPLSQSKRFDPDGAFIREHCPELRSFDERSIHWPAGTSPDEQREAGCIIGRDYPEPIVDHVTQRTLALELFREARR